MKIALKTSSFVLTCAMAICVLPSAWAGNDADKHFKKLDANGDGKVTRAEHAAGAIQMFIECDANADGIVTAAEMDAAMAAQGEKPGAGDKSSAEKIKVIDQNGDGRLTAMEHQTGSEKMFAQMDTDGDGSLSKEECEQGTKKLKKDS